MHVIHVVTPPRITAPDVAVPGLTPADIEELSKALRNAVHKEEIAASTEVIVATAVGTAILESASHVKAGLVVMGTHGRGGFKRLVLGSVAEQVVRNSTSPVVVMRPPEVIERPSRLHV